MTHSKSFIIALSKLMGQWLVCEGSLSGLMSIQRTALFQTYGIKPNFDDIKAVTSCSTHKIDQQETDG